MPGGRNSDRKKAKRSHQGCSLWRIATKVRIVIKNPSIHGGRMPTFLIGKDSFLHRKLKQNAKRAEENISMSSVLAYRLTHKRAKRYHKKYDKLILPSLLVVSFASVEISTHEREQKEKEQCITHVTRERKNDSPRQAHREHRSPFGTT